MGDGFEQRNNQPAKIVRQRPISTARSEHSGEREIVKEKVNCSIIQHGKDYGKTIEITGPDRECDICGGQIAIEAEQPICQVCGAVFGSGTKKKRERTPEQARKWGADRFMKAMAY